MANRKKDRTVVIESPRYQKEAEALAKDPIIIEMERTLPAKTDLDAWEFINAANRVYTERGGKLAHSIGGPARAIAIIRKGKA